MGNREAANSRAQRASVFHYPGSGRIVAMPTETQPLATELPARFFSNLSSRSSRHHDYISGLQFDILSGVFAVNCLFVVEWDCCFLAVHHSQDVNILDACELSETAAAGERLQRGHLWQQRVRARPDNFSRHVNPAAVNLGHANAYLRIIDIVLQLISDHIRQFYWR